MNRNKILIFFIISIVTIFAITIYIYNNNKFTNKEKSDSDAQRLSTEIKLNEQKAEEEYKLEHPSETELSTYSTILKDKASGRINNIKITCNTLNNHIVKSGETFSFEELVGPATTAKGYQKAKVIENGKTIQALGGGNCQVSSTLYNAVLAVPELEVTERHPHGKRVTYVPKGKDAAVSHGSYDFKFKNNLPNDIKMYLSTDEEQVYVKLVKITN